MNRWGAVIFVILLASQIQCGVKKPPRILIDYKLLETIESKTMTEQYESFQPGNTQFELTAIPWLY